MTKPQDPDLRSARPALDPWWLVALGLWLVPLLLLLPLGLLWLYQQGIALLWFAIAVLCGLAGLGLQSWLRRRERRLLDSRPTGPDPDWPPAVAAAWTLVEEMAAGLDPADWPLERPERLALLGREVLERVARHFHPEVEQPLLELRVPDALLILERASRDLRRRALEQIPFSHRLTIGDLLRAYRWRALIERVIALYRAGRLVADPMQALMGELWGRLQAQGLAAARSELQRWLLQEAVRLLGRYAIELYSGRLLPEEVEPLEAITQISRLDLKRTADTDREPLRILILGRTNSGKSSLINALFAEPRAASDLIPGTTPEFVPYRFEGIGPALILDSPGIESLDLERLKAQSDQADLILWVSAIHRPDRQAERRAMESLRAHWAAHPDRHPPPLLGVATHIDLLRPAREWQPPYDLQNPNSLKARNIRDALIALAEDLGLPFEQVIPVCLAPGRVYNIADGLWTALIAQLEQANRVRLLRCQLARRRESHWRLLRRQLATVGRLVLRWPVSSRTKDRPAGKDL